MTTVLTVSVILFGILAYLRLPVNDLPAVDYPVIQVQASYPGASPETIERERAARGQAAPLRTPPPGTVNPIINPALYPRLPGPIYEP